MKIEKHQWCARGPFCYGFGETRDQAVKGMLSCWPGEYLAGDLKKPKGLDPEAWTEDQQKVTTIQVVPEGSIYISHFDGSIEWFLEPHTTRGGEVMETVDHDPWECETCTIEKPSED